MKKKLFGILLALSMILCLFPVVALAEEDENPYPSPGQPISLKITQIAATITAPKLGQAPDYNPVLTADQENSVELDSVTWYKIAVEDFTGTYDDDWASMEEDEVFETGYYYSSDIYVEPLEGYAFSESITGTINGFPHDSTYEDIYARSYAYLSHVFDPLYEITTYEIPFTKVVKQGGSIAPGQETFTLELFEIRAGDIADFPDVSYTATVTTNGAGEQVGKIVFTGPEDQLLDILVEGFMVREQKGSAEGWTYSDAVWGAHAILSRDFNWPELKFDRIVFYPATDESAITDKMTFENTYTANPAVEEPTETPTEAPTTAPTEAPKPVKKANSVKTDDPNNSSNIALWLSVLFVGGAGLVKIISKRKELAEKY